VICVIHLREVRTDSTHRDQSNDSVPPTVRVDKCSDLSVVYQSLSHKAEPSIVVGIVGLSESAYQIPFSQYEMDRTGGPRHGSDHRLYGASEVSATGGLVA
jgi:hypothetical protein